MFRSKKEYRVSVGDDWVEPEETLLDTGSEHQDLEQPIGNQVFRTILVGSSVSLFLLWALSFWLGVIQHDYYETLAYQNRSVNFSIPPPRGIIFDRNGTALVKNTPSFDLLVVSRELDLDHQETFQKAAEILGLPLSDFFDLIKVKAKENGIFFTATDLTKDQVLALKFLDLKGFYIIPGTKRHYVDGSKFSQIVGYVGRVSKTDLEDPYYAATDSIGKLGIEGQYEDYLRGEHGRILFTNGSDEEILEAKSGRNIVLTVNSELQSQLYTEMSDVLRGAGLSRGAAVVQNPNTGEVLAMVSFPSFDNNLFTESLSEQSYKKLFENPAQPLFNRVIRGLYNPGSTIKPLIGLMALEDAVITPGDVIHDCISLTIANPVTGETAYTFKNWREDFGSFNLRRSIANSCNIYFFTIGGGYGRIAGLGVNSIVQYLKSALANTVLGIDLPGEQKGLVPDPDWKKETKGEPWYLGDTYNISIGQGDLLVTPLWLNSYISAVANGGTMYRPFVVSRVVDNEKKSIEVFKPTELTKLPFSDSTFREVKAGMEETVQSGTAQMLKSIPVKIAAKTGTAEVVKGQTTNSLFTAFAPADNPQISITVLIEGIRTNQALALAVANNFLRWYFQAPAPTPSIINTY